MDAGTGDFGGAMLPRPPFLATAWRGIERADRPQSTVMTLHSCSISGNLEAKRSLAIDGARRHAQEDSSVSIQH